jgi:Fe-S-cluster containining protein
VNTLVQIQVGDRRLLEGVGEALADAARRSGDWLVCHAGCTQCCIGPFGITALDALRLREGFDGLDAADPARAAAVRARAAAYIEAIAPIYPGDPATGELHDEDALPDSMDEIACPALDPGTGRCELYSARPITCRVFGPATLAGGDILATCELCYEGATDSQILACAVDVDPEGLEKKLLASLAETGPAGTTIVAYALLAPTPSREG